MLRIQTRMCKVGVVMHAHFRFRIDESIYSFILLCRPASDPQPATGHLNYPLPLPLLSAITPASARRHMAQLALHCANNPHIRTPARE